MTHALVCIDYVNDIVASGGKLSGKGYAQFANEYETLRRVAELQHAFRSRALPVVHVRVSFDAEYLNHPKKSPLFGSAQKFGALQEGQWGTEFVESVRPIPGELVLSKPRVSAFYGTALSGALQVLGVTDLMLCGVATDLAVQSAARDAHDRDFVVTVVADSCAAASEEDHNQSLVTMSKIATVASVAQAIEAL